MPTHVLAIRTTQGPVVKPWQRWLLQLLLQRRALSITVSKKKKKKRILTKSSSCNYRSCVPSTHGINVMYHVTTNPKIRSSSSLSQGEEKKVHEWRSWLVCGGSGWVPVPALGFLSLQIQVSACRNRITPSERPLPFMPNFCRYYYLKGRNPIYPSINSLYHLPQHRLYHSQISIRQQFRIPI